MTKPVVRVILNPGDLADIEAASVSTNFEPLEKICGVEVRTNELMRRGMIGYAHPDGSLSIGRIQDKPDSEEEE